jgi:hypothetical protein
MKSFNPNKGNYCFFISLEFEESVMVNDLYNPNKGGGANIEADDDEIIELNFKDKSLKKPKL